MMDTPVLTIGILAHVDAGKTSLTECLLYQSGATKSQGSVDKGSAITDGLAMEKSRGISIKASSVNFAWEKVIFQLIDTPGHIDFAAEVDRSLSILDGVILVISAKEGIQAHTLSLWESLRERKLPVIVFFNKIDRAGVDAEQVFTDFEKDLAAKLFALNFPELSDPDHPQLISFRDSDKTQHSPILDSSLENLAECDEQFLNDYLEGNTSDLEGILEKAKRSINKGELYASLFGSAKLGMGIEDLLDSLAALFPLNTSYYSTPSAKVFKVTLHEKHGMLAHIKSFGSVLKSKDVLYSQKLGKDIKINRLYKFQLGSLEQCSEIKPGEIGVISTSGLIHSGDVLGTEILNDPFSKISKY